MARPMRDHVSEITRSKRDHICVMARPKRDPNKEIDTNIKSIIKYNKWK